MTQLGLMDHLGIQEFMVLGFCIGGPFIWSLLQRAMARVLHCHESAYMIRDWRRLPHGCPWSSAQWRGRARQRRVLPEGQEVTVLTPETVPTNARLEGSCPHSVLDIPTVRVGAVLRPLTSEPHEFFDQTGAYDAYGLSKLLVKLDECAP